MSVVPVPRLQSVIDSTLIDGGGPVTPEVGTYNITENFEFPVGITVIMPTDTIFNIASGKTVTVNCPLFAPNTAWHTGAGTVVYGPGSVLGFLPLTPGSYSARAFGALGDNTNDDTAEIQAACAAVALAGGGIVLLEAGNYKITSPIALPYGVSLVGVSGTASVLRPVACHAITLEFYGAGFGNAVLSDFGINGTSCTSHTGILNAGTTDEEDQFYGLTIERVLTQNMNRGVKLGAVRNIVIRGNWFQTVTKGIVFEGQTINASISDNEIVWNGGCGAGTATGFHVTTYNYTTGGGVLNPEGVHFQHNHVFGFPTSINIEACTLATLTDNDLDATIYGIEFTSANNGFIVRDNYITMSGVGALIGIIGHGIASEGVTRTTIEGNAIITAAASTCVGIQVNDSGNQNQNNVRVIGNYTRVTSTDITIANGRYVWVYQNVCDSPAPVYSINVVNAIVGNGPIYIAENRCAKVINYNAAEVVAGELILGPNTINSTTLTGHHVTAIADATDAASAITQLNLVLAMLRAQGKIAT